MEPIDVSKIRRIGSLIPSTNAMLEIEFNRVLPRHYQLHVSRLQMGPINETGFRMQDADIDYQSRLMRSLRVEYVVLAQTNVSFFAADYDETVTRRITDATGAPSATAGALLGQGIKFLGARRIAFISPYGDELNAMGRKYYQDKHGLEVTRLGSIGQAATSDMVNDINPEVGWTALKGADGPDVDGFIIAGAMPTLHSIAGWEQALGKPVATTIQAAMWGALQATGGETIKGYGRLLEEKR